MAHELNTVPGRLQWRCNLRLLGRVKLPLNLIEVRLKLFVGRSELLLGSDKSVVILKSRIASTQQVQVRTECWLPDCSDTARASVLTETSRLHIRKLSLHVARNKPESQSNEHGDVFHSFVFRSVR